MLLDQQNMFQTQFRRAVTSAAKSRINTTTITAATATIGIAGYKYHSYHNNTKKSQHTQPPTLLTHFHTLASVPDTTTTNNVYTPRQTELIVTETDETPKAEGQKQAKKTPASQAPDRSCIDDGRQQVEVPIRVFPSFVPITLEEANKLGPAGQVRYVFEHIADFFRNRVDDISYLFTGEIQDQLHDPSRYEDAYAQKDPKMPFNAYYESIYRGWYDTHAIRMKTGGTVPRFDYSKWLLFNPRPQVYFDMIVPDGNDPNAEKIPERIVVQLYYDYLPNCTQNMIGLCDGFIDTDRFISYNHTYVHRVDHGHAFFAGDVLKRNGSEGTPFFANHEHKYLADERFNLPHDGPGCVVLDNRGPNTNTSHFFITQRAMPELEGKYMVIGHVLSGIETVRKIDNVPTDEEGKPLYPIKILKSGILINNVQKDDPFEELKKEVPQMKDRVATLTPPPVENNPDFIYP